MQWLPILSLVIGFVRVQGQNPVCGLPANPRFQAREDDVPFCVVIRGDVHDANGTLEQNATYFTWYYPSVDEFTLFELDLAAEIYRNDSFVRIEVGDYVSEEVQYSSNDGVVFALHGYFDLVGGQIREWVWDPNAEALCDENTPVLDRFCSQTRAACFAAEGNLDCDLQIYAGWSGTDVNDVFLQSRESLISGYRRFSTADLYVRAAESAQNQIEQIPRLPEIENPFPLP